MTGMLMLRKVGLAWLLVMVVILLTAPVVSAATGYPTRTDRYVNDYAGVLDQSSEQEIRDLFEKLESDTGIEAVAVTVSSIQDYGTGETDIESFAAHLFNLWGVGDVEKDNGVLILVAVTDRTCRIQLGAGYDSGYDSAMRQVIDDHMIPCFGSGDYQTGIVEGARGTVSEVKKSSGLSGEDVRSWVSEHKTLVIVIAVVVVIALIALWLLSRARAGRSEREVSATEDGEVPATEHHDHYYNLQPAHSRHHGGGSGSRRSSGGGRSFGGGASGKW
jgi:uncharacterized protein